MQPGQMWSRGRCTQLHGKKIKGLQSVSSHRWTPGSALWRVQLVRSSPRPHESPVGWPKEVAPSLPPSQFRPAFQAEVLRKTCLGPHLWAVNSRRHGCYSQYFTPSFKTNALLRVQWLHFLGKPLSFKMLPGIFGNLPM